MSQSNPLRDEATIPLLPKISQQKLPSLKNYSSVLSAFINEAISIAKISYPLALTGLFLYIRYFVSLSFLGGLGDATLAGGSLAAAFANITGYSLFSGLTMGVESICSQAFGARRYNYVRMIIKRGIILLLFTSLPLASLWINMETILLMLKHDKKLASEAHIFLLYSVPDLIAQSCLHPLRVYLRTQSKTLPLSICTVIASVLHLPVTFFFVWYLGLGIKGIALSGVVFNFNLVVFLFLYIYFFEEKISFDEEEEEKITEETYECGVREWTKLLCLAIPSCISVCLEWWCYAIMILLCGFLLDPKASVASVGILSQISSLVYIFPNSLSLGVSTRVGNDLGSNQPQRARRAAVVGLGLSIALGFIAFKFTVSVGNTWVMFITDDKEILKLTTMVLPIVGLCELLNCLQTTCYGVLRGSARPNIVANIKGVAFYVVGIPVGGVLAFWFGFGFKGLWLGLLAAQMSCVIGMMAATWRTDWEMEAERAKKLTTTSAHSGSTDDDDFEPTQEHPQVFLNYRGKQLRYSFVSHLVDAFARNCIHFFVDSNEQRGNDLQNLFLRIKESKIALAIFSTRYAESTWCLDELVKMKRLSVEGILKIIPIFYKVKAEEVRNQTGEFGDNFWKLARKGSTTGNQIKEWKEALEYISNKAGLSLGEEKPETDFVKEVVQNVQSVLATIRLEEEANHSIKKKRKDCKSELPYSKVKQNLKN